MCDGLIFSRPTRSLHHPHHPEPLLSPHRPHSIDFTPLSLPYSAPARSLSTTSILRDPVRPSDDLKKAHAKSTQQEEKKKPDMTAAEKKDADAAKAQAQRDSGASPDQKDTKYGSANTKEGNATKAEK